MSVFQTIEWTDDGVRMIEPDAAGRRGSLRYLLRLREVAEAIRSLVIRGAPAHRRGRRHGNRARRKELNGPHGGGLSIRV